MGKRKPYYRFTVDRVEGKFTTHTVELTSEAKAPPHEAIEVIGKPDHTFVDEVVISPWLHIEAMDKRTYWMSISGVTLWVHLRKDGSVKRVMVYAPGQFDDAREGVEYEMDCGEHQAERPRRRALKGDVKVSE